MLWVKPETFLFGIIPHSPLAHLDAEVLLTLGSNSSDGGVCSFSTWSKWAAQTCQIKPDIAWMYFETFHLVAEPSLSRTGSFDAVRRASSKVQDKDAVGSEMLAKLRGAIIIPRVSFIIFLFIQRYRALSLRQRVDGDSWPSPEPSTRGQDHGDHSSDVSSRLQFATKHMTELLQLVLSCCVNKHTTAPQKALQTISTKQLSDLDFLFSTASTAEPLHEWCKRVGLSDEVDPQQSNNIGYDKATRSFSYSLLGSWLTTALQHAPHRADQEGSVVQLDDGQVLVKSISRKTIRLERPPSSSVGMLSVDRCNSATLYLLVPFTNAAITNCKNTTIVLSAVGGTVVLSKCRNTTLVSASQRLLVNNCDGCTMFTYTSMQPVLQEATRGLVLGPLASACDAMEEHIDCVQLKIDRNLWSNPLLLISRGAQACSFDLMTPDDFYPLTIPFCKVAEDFQKTAKMLAVPPAYVAAVVAKETFVTHVERELKALDVDTESKVEFAQHLEKSFLEWLELVGASRQLEDLIQLDTDAQNI
eukprot:m.149906 g.149906  ORF g.149906 m.149906 type:complete len:530 (-) comp30691_c0_seq1:76-1665(-)